jgi:hypothetical protein
VQDVQHDARGGAGIVELTVARGLIDRPELGVTAQRRQMQRRQNEHGVSLFDSHAREKFKREQVVFESGEEDGVEGQALVVFGRQRKVITLSRVIEVKFGRFNPSILI